MDGYGATKQSRLNLPQCGGQTGLLRRFAPRNDDAPGLSKLSNAVIGQSVGRMTGEFKKYRPVIPVKACHLTGGSGDFRG